MRTEIAITPQPPAGYKMQPATGWTQPAWKAIKQATERRPAIESEATWAPEIPKGETWSPVRRSDGVWVWAIDRVIDPPATDPAAHTKPPSINPRVLAEIEDLLTGWSVSAPRLSVLFGDDFDTIAVRREREPWAGFSITPAKSTSAHTPPILRGDPAIAICFNDDLDEPGRDAVWKAGEELAEDIAEVFGLGLWTQG